jgi:hypothetical protein
MDDVEQEGMLFFTEELNHAYTRIFRFLQDILIPEEYDLVKFIHVTQLIERVQSVQNAAVHYYKPGYEEGGDKARCSPREPSTGKASAHRATGPRQVFPEASDDYTGLNSSQPDLSKQKPLSMHSSTRNSMLKSNAVMSPQHP